MFFSFFALFASTTVVGFVDAAFVRAGAAAFTGPPGPTFGNRDGVRADAISRPTSARCAVAFVAPVAVTFAAVLAMLAAVVDAVDGADVVAETLRRG